MKSVIVEATHTAEEKVQRYYTWRAGNYDIGSRFEIEHHREAIRLAGIQSGQQILDVACGTGRATIDLAKAVGPEGQVIALDLTEAMLAQAREKTEKHGLGSRVQFKQGNARSLPFPDESLDLVYNGYMFDLIPIRDFLPILKEFSRVLKPGGKLVLVNMSKPSPRKTVFEKVYEKGWAVMPCRPVMMSPLLGDAGFMDITRLYRPSRGLIVSRLWGTEIVMARKPAA